MKFTLTSGLALTALCLAAALPAKAATLSPGDLIKASGPAVYYYSQNGKRLVFPTENTYKSWYQDFSGIKTITDNELAAIPLGGNVTYRPGIKLVKITTDPKVYAVSSGGTLRWIATETVASTLYGQDWNTKVDDIPDAFFINYNLGSTINSANDFSPSQITALATTIDANKAVIAQTCTICNQTPTSTTPTTTLLDINLTLSKTTIKAGDVITLTAQTNAANQTKSIKLFFNDALINTCNNTNSCAGQIAVPLVLDKSVYEARATATDLDSREYSDTVQTSVDTSAASNNATIRADQYTLRSGQSTGITVDAPDIAVSRIDIYVDDSARISCQSGIRTCKLSHTFSGSIGATHTARGLITDNIGRTYQTKNIILTIAENDTPTITLTADKPLINTGETVGITVEASDQDGIKSLDLLDANKVVLKHCDGAAPCKLIIGPFSSAGTIYIYGHAADLLNATGEEVTSINVQKN